ncbi:MAG: SusC/RagA family TonB-linked outer membrane protein [Bacteroidota bacterium]|nr:SusC/RagA family TonB-linked outer membrane protein [Bacteroidota bacterium]
MKKNLFLKLPYPKNKNFRVAVYGKTSLFILFLMFMNFSLFAQSIPQKEIVGTVKDGTTNEVLPGVNVVIEGTLTGTMTDIDGKFNIKVPSDSSILVFSFMGYAREKVLVTRKSSIEVTLKPDVKSLDEVVVIGYGEQSRSKVTASISKVNAEEFTHSPSANPMLQMQGKVAGLTLQISDGQPGANPQIFIRGGTSTSPEGDSPLIIVDGIVGSMRNLSELNSSDIETVQVLKDAASTAIYGARAANGIIIVKTKSGSIKTKPTINFKVTTGSEQLGKKYNFTSARDYIQVSRYNTFMYNTTNPSMFLNGGTYGMSTGNPRNSKNTLEFLDTYIQNYGQNYVTDLLDNQGWQTMADPVTGKKLIFKETNYQDVTFQKANKQEYDFNISGGGEKTSYYMGVGYLDQGGIVFGTYTKDYSFLLNGTYKLSDSWKIYTDIKYQIRDYKGVDNYQNVLGRSVTMPFTYRLNYEDGTPAPGEGVTSFRNRNHEWFYRDQYDDNKIYRNTIKVGADWDILPGLSFNPSVYWFTTDSRSSAFEAYNEVNKNRNASESDAYIREAQVDLLLNYKKDIKKNHFSSVLGSSYINDFNYAMSGSGYGAPTDNVKTLNATSTTTQKISTTQSYDAMLSFFGRINYDWDNKYLATVSLRDDGSSKFADNNKWALFPGVSVGWNINNEAFWKSMAKYIPAFKLRSSWGQAGNNDLSIYDTQGQYSTAYQYEGAVGILNTTLANKNLKWETTTSFDLGTDIGLLNNKVTIALDYYSKLTSDRIFNKPLDTSTGFSSITSNYGTIRTRGFEVELEATPVSNKDFSWDVNFTFAFNRSIVVKLPDNGAEKHRIGGNTVYDPKTKTYKSVGGFAEGERYGGRWAYHLTGVYATDADAANAPYDVEANGRTKHGGDAIWEDVDGNGQIDHQDMIFMGYIRPDKTGGLVNTLRYKSFTLRFVADYALGHVIDNSFRGRLNGSARNNNMTLTDVLSDKIWKKQGDIASIPKYTVQSDADYNFRNHLRNPNNLGSSSGYTTNNSLYYSKGDFLAFRELSLSYRFTSKAMKYLHYVSGMEVFGGIYNMGYLTAYDGLMPEIYTGNDQGSYARPLEINFGAQLTF